MHVTICDLTGQLTRTRRQHLESRLAALVREEPWVDGVEVDLDSPTDTSGGRRRRVRVTLRAGHQRVVRVSDEAPTLAVALDRAMADVAREGHALGARGGQTLSPTLH